MAHLIDADKLIIEVKDWRNRLTGFGWDAVNMVLEIINSLQQEQPEVKLKKEYDEHPLQGATFNQFNPITMGWTYKPAKFYKNGKVDRKAELDAEFTWSDERGSGQILKSTMVGTTYYAAFKRTRENGESQVYAIVALTNIDRNSWCNFGYKDMSEDMGPSEINCPESILSLLSPTVDKYALQWRKDCKEERMRKSKKSSLSLLPIGTVIEIELLGKKERLRKMSPSFQFKTPFWMFVDRNAYLPKNRIPSNYIVVN